MQHLPLLGAALLDSIWDILGSVLVYFLLLDHCWVIAGCFPIVAHGAHGPWPLPGPGPNLALGPMWAAAKYGPGPIGPVGYWLLGQLGLGDWAWWPGDSSNNRPTIRQQ